MSDWLFQPGFDALTRSAIWSIIAVAVTTVVLFLYTVGLRVATRSAERRRERLRKLWRPLFAQSLAGELGENELTLPKIRANERIDLMEEWNRTRSMVEGGAVNHLIELALVVGLAGFAEKLFRKRSLRSRLLAVQTIGHLRLHLHFKPIAALIDDDNPALSVTAAAACVDIDPDRSVELIVPRISQRRDWPKTRVSILLRQAGSERLSEPMYRAIRSADSNHDKTYLLQFGQLIEADVLDTLCCELIRESNDPGVLNAALKLVRGYLGVPRLEALVNHEAWFVRLQAAKVLSRIGSEKHLPLLEGMLSDSQWWVRYRAAQAITRLPYLGPNQLRALQARQQDPFATDILQQCFAEVGIA